MSCFTKLVCGESAAFQPVMAEYQQMERVRLDRRGATYGGNKRVIDLQKELIVDNKSSHKRKIVQRKRNYGGRRAEVLGYPVLSVERSMVVLLDVGVTIAVGRIGPGQTGAYPEEKEQHYQTYTG